MLLDVYLDLLQRDTKPIELILAGDGPLRTAVEEFRQRHESAHIEMLGQVPYREIAAHYQNCSVFVLLSLSDCNPLVIFEALHSGVPIVCTDRAGTAPDFIIPGENGYIVDPLDRTDIAERVHDVLNWDDERRQNAACVSRRMLEPVTYSAAARAFINACSLVS